MNFNQYYEPISKNIWSGRIDDPNDPTTHRWHQVVETLDLQNTTQKMNSEEFGICFLGFKCDQGVKRNLGRPGAANAPDEIRKNLSNLPYNFDYEIKLFDAGNIVEKDGTLEDLQASLAYYVEKILKLGFFPIVLGGGHETALGHFNGLQRYSSENIGIYQKNK